MSYSSTSADTPQSANTPQNETQPRKFTAFTVRSAIAFGLIWGFCNGIFILQHDLGSWVSGLYAGLWLALLISFLNNLVRIDAADGRDAGEAGE